MVIAPTLKGNVHLMAFNRSGFFLDAFANIPWDTDLEFVEFWSKIRMAEKSCEVLGEKKVVDFTNLDLSD